MARCKTITASIPSQLIIIRQVKGFRNSPLGERRIGALTAMKARAPVLGGNFGVYVMPCILR